MSHIDDIQRGIDFIEANLDEPLDLRDVSQAARFSHAHYQRMFKALTGETLQSYVRSRRMAGALERLATTDLRILDIALSAGFESQEAFARAFRRSFGMTPSEYRSIGARNVFPRKLRIDQEYLHNVGELLLEPEIEERTQMTVAGLCTTYLGPGSEKNRLGADLEGLWDEFLTAVPSVPSMTPMPLFGVITATPNDERLDYLAAGEVTGPAVHSLVSRTVPAGKYAVFTHRGFARQIDKTVDYIYGTWLMKPTYRHTCGPDIEIYGAEWSAESEDSVMHYAIPIE